MYPVCEEVSVEMFVNDTHFITFMCTPENLKELAAGHLFNRGLIQFADDVHSLKVCNNLKKIYLHSDFIDLQNDSHLGSVIASSCGSGISTKLKFDKSIESNYTTTLSEIKNSAVEMFKNAVKHRETGGMHSCALMVEGIHIASLEDVGRHNAVDKVIGNSLLKDLSFDRSCLISTGRISADMVLKAANAGVPIIASRSIPTSSALELALKYNITLIGRIMSEIPTIYSCWDRIK